MDSFTEDRCVKNTLKTSHDFDKREKILRSEFGNREHCCAHYVGVTKTKSQEFLKKVSKFEHPETESLGSSKINISVNERFTVPHINTDISKDVHSAEEYLRKTSFLESRCSGAKKVADNIGSDHSSCNYLGNNHLLVKTNTENECDKSVSYSKQAQPKLVGVSSGAEREYFKALSSLQTGCSGLQTDHSSLQTSNSNTQTRNSCLQTENSGLQTGNSGLQTGNSNLQTGNSVLETGNSSSETGNSSLQTGNSSLQTCNSSLVDNGKLSGPCKYSVSTPKKSISEDGLSCRICHSVTDLETLVSPCLCTGSMKYVHESCLLNWLKSSVKTSCELCLHEVPVKKLVKPLREWRFLDEKPVAIIWLLSFLILLTLNILSVIKDASRGCTSTTCIVFYVLGCTGAILGVIFLWFWAKKSAVYFTKLLTLNQVWLLDEKYSKTEKKPRILAISCNV